jgi:hypothetical protein
MFNFCVISGYVYIEPTRRFYGKDHPITEFEIDIWLGSHRGGSITVLCPDELSLKARLYVKESDIVVACGYLSGDAWQGRDGSWKSLHLIAVELAVLDHEVLRQEQEALMDQFTSKNLPPGDR